jgi:hypothetical protein
MRSEIIIKSIETMLLMFTVLLTAKAQTGNDNISKKDVAVTIQSKMPSEEALHGRSKTHQKSAHASKCFYE